jgi:hypothetical protein
MVCNHLVCFVHSYHHVGVIINTTWNINIGTPTVSPYMLSEIASRAHQKDKLNTVKTLRLILMTQIHPETQNDQEGFISDHSELI